MHRAPGTGTELTDQKNKESFPLHDPRGSHVFTAHPHTLTGTSIQDSSILPGLVDRYASAIKEKHYIVTDPLLNPEQCDEMVQVRGIVSFPCIHTL